MSTLLYLPFQLGEPRASDGLVVTPIYPTADPVCDYVSLDEALEGGLAVAEVSPEGSVGELRVRNPLGTAALLYDGEELVGAKQNRILNLTVLVGASTELTVPVSCVERGRWDWKGPSFRAAGHISYPDLRRAKAAMLHADALRIGVAQHAVWDAVDSTLRARGVASPTSAASDALDADRPRIDRIGERLPLEPGQCGAVVAIGERWCVDWVSRPAVFARLYPKLLAGYAFDAVGAAGKPVEAGRVVEQLTAAACRPGRSAGLGDDLRLEGAGLLGSGLGVAGELVQLSAYGDRR
jgi:hypothetical protein